MYALAQKNNGSAVYSSTYLVIEVTGGPATSTATPTQSAAPGGCVGQDRGNFGQLQSPRTGYSMQQGFPYNIALGIDHVLVPYVFPTGVAEDKDCGKNSPALPGGKLDDSAGADGDGANCVKGDPGNDGPKTYDGLLAGPDASTPGRLDVANGATRCSGRSDLGIAGATINNDTLACYLRNGATRAQIAATSGVDQSMVDPSIVDSPRFVWLPVVYATDRSQKDFQPIRRFVPGFITEETQAGGPNDSAGHINGMDINGNSVETLYIYTFNPDVLPPNEQAGTVDYDADVGGAIVRLVG